MSKRLQERLERHRRFWNKETTDRPLIGFKIINSYFPAQWFKSGEPLLHDNLVITPEMLDVNKFAAECEAIYLTHEATGQDLFWTAEPYTAVPWLEAMSGCQVNGSPNSLWATSWLSDWSQVKQLQFDLENPWLQKYREFLVALSDVSQGRFPIGQPIVRGPLDVISALRGASQFAMDFYKNPEQIRNLIVRLGEMFTTLVQIHIETVPSFHDGYAMGFYHLWAPGKCIWFQEDASALLSPRFYHNFAKEVDTKICSTYPYTLVHLHPSSFFILDDLLAIDPLQVIQINKDIGGPSIAEMMPLFKKVLAKKRLMIWGDLSSEEIGLLMQELPYEGLALCVLTSSAEEAKWMMDAAVSRVK